MAQLSPRMAHPVVDSTVADAASRFDGVEGVYRSVSGRMWRALFAFSGDADVASDAVAEAFAQALRRDGEIRDVERWVWKAAYRIAAGELKQRRTVSPEVDRPVDDAASSFELRDALLRVSPKQRAALFLFYYCGYEPREIARMIGSTQSAVRVHLFRGRKHLASMLDGGTR